MAIIIFKSILSIAGLGNIDGTLVSTDGNNNLQIVPANNTSTTQFVFGQERSLLPHPKTRNINQRKSKEINLSATKKKTRPKTNRVQKGYKKKKKKASNKTITHE